MQERSIGRVNVHAHGPSTWLNAFMNRQEGFVVPTTLDEANTVIHTVHHSQHTGRQGLDHSIEAFHGLVDSIKSSESISRLVLLEGPVFAVNRGCQASSLKSLPKAWPTQAKRWCASDATAKPTQN